MHPSINGHIGEINDKNRHKKQISVRWILSSNKFENLADTMPQTHVAAYRNNVANTIKWSLLSSLIGNGLKNSNPKTKIRLSAIRHKNNLSNFVNLLIVDRFCLTFLF